MYRIVANAEKDILAEIAKMLRNTAQAERHHAARLYRGKKYETEKREYCARELEHLAEAIGEQMEIVWNDVYAIQNDDGSRTVGKWLVQKVINGEPEQATKWPGLAGYIQT